MQTHASVRDASSTEESTKVATEEEVNQYAPLMLERARLFSSLNNEGSLYDIYPMCKLAFSMI